MAAPKLSDGRKQLSPPEVQQHEPLNHDHGSEGGSAPVAKLTVEGATVTAEGHKPGAEKDNPENYRVLGEVEQTVIEAVTDIDYADPADIYARRSNIVNE
jgi:hypothetical protein